LRCVLSWRKMSTLGSKQPGYSVLIFSQLATRFESKNKSWPPESVATRDLLQEVNEAREIIPQYYHVLYSHDHDATAKFQRVAVSSINKRGFVVPIFELAREEDRKNFSIWGVSAIYVAVSVGNWCVELISVGEFGAVDGKYPDLFQKGGQLDSLSLFCLCRWGSIPSNFGYYRRHERYVDPPSCQPEDKQKKLIRKRAASRLEPLFSEPFTTTSPSWQESLTLSGISSQRRPWTTLVTSS